MIKKILVLMFLALYSTASFAYDANKAKDFDTFYSKMDQKACANSKLYISADETMKYINADKEYLILDVRSEGEYAVMGVRLPKSMHIPINKLFTKENLDKLPTKTHIIVTCHSGTRGLMVVMALKQMGFANTQVLEGGLIALANANTPATAPMK